MRSAFLYGKCVKSENKRNELDIDIIDRNGSITKFLLLINFGRKSNGYL